MPLDSVVLSTTGITFSATMPLRGTGVVAIVGNTTIGQGSYSAFSGLLYVDGDLVVREPCEIQGAVVVTGSVTIQGASDYATLSYDDGILEHLRQEIGTYRLSSAMSRPVRPRQLGRSRGRPQGRDGRVQAGLAGSSRLLACVL